MDQKDKGSIQILANPSASIPSLCKFTVARPLSLEGILTCKSREVAQGSPLLEALFDLPDLREVLIEGNLVSVATHESAPEWKVLGKKIGDIIRGQLLSETDLFPKALLHKWTGKAIVAPSPANAPVGEFDPALPVVKEILKLLEEQINPAVASHGGRISLVNFKEGKLFLKMEGGCQGCGQAQLTLRQGVEKAIKQQIPDVKEVIDVTDHQSGSTPYY